LQNPHGVADAVADDAVELAEIGTRMTLMRRQETQDILALLRVLADSSDTLAFGALIRDPLVGLSEQELLDITATLPPSDAGDRRCSRENEKERIVEPSCTGFAHDPHLTI
jgi:ATP-dependent exoDNAse (exonuclease V) beta subunit